MDETTRPAQEPTKAQPAAPESAPLSLALTAEAALGLLLGVVMIPLFAGTVGLLLSHWANASNLGMGMLTITLLSAVVGFVLGAGLGVGLAGRWLRQGGSLWRAWLGAALGAAVVLILVIGFGLGGSNFVQFGLLFVGSLAAALAGYHLRRKPGRPA